MLVGKKLANQNLNLIPASQLLKNKKIVIYFFSASWVKAPDLLTKLKMIYDENIKRNTGMEIIFVSADTEEKSFLKEYACHGPWLAIPFKSDTAVELRWKYDITSLPQLIVVKVNSGIIISRKGREELMNLGLNVLVTWSEYLQE